MCTPVIVGGGTIVHPVRETGCTIHGRGGLDGNRQTYLNRGVGAVVSSSGDILAPTPTMALWVPTHMPLGQVRIGTPS